MKPMGTNGWETGIPIVEQIQSLIQHADRMEEIEFRLRLEELVEKGGNESLNLIIHTITTTLVSPKIRLNLIRIAGYILNTAFIPPLKKVIELSTELDLRIAAIISIAKFNDKRAVDILEQALTKISNPAIQEIIISQINLIKRNNPLINLMPQFLRGSSDPESFPIVVKIFRRILTPNDAKGFIPYLKNPDPRIENGAHEILCSRGDDTVRFFLAEFFKRKLTALDPEWQREAVIGLLSSLIEYAGRTPTIAGLVVDDLHSFLSRVDDREIESRIQDIVRTASAQKPED
jgi:HEAT repeat protein